MVLYGCVIWSLASREEHRLRAFENRVLRRIFGPKRDEVTEKRPIGIPRRRWVDNIRMDLGEVGWGDVDWIGLAQDRNRRRALVTLVLNLRVPLTAGKLSSGLTSSGLSNSAQLHGVS
jgi:hypothetical protein